MLYEVITNPMEVIGAGDIGAGVGFKDIRTGDTLCSEGNVIKLESMDFPEPVIGVITSYSIHYTKLYEHYR